MFVHSCSNKNKQKEDNLEKAIEFFNNEDYNKSLSYVNTLIETDSLDYVSWTLKGRILFNLGQDKKGINAINKAIEINPDYHKAYSYRATMNYLSGNHNVNEIISDINIALSDNPDNVELIKLKAGYLYESNKFLKAKDEYDKILSIKPNDYEALVEKSVINSKIGNIELSLKGFRQAIKIEPLKTYAYEVRGDFFIKQEEYEKAISDYDKVIQNIQDNDNFKQNKSYTLNNRGFAYFKIGENEKALSDINNSLKILPTNSYAFKNRALVYLKTNKINKACKDLKKAIELGYSEKYDDEVEKLNDKNCG